jgi:hypothetical protein
MSTPFGFLMASSREYFTTLDAEASGLVCRSWEELHGHLSRHLARRQSSAHLDSMDSLERDALASVLRIAQRSRPELDVADLYRSIGAHGVRVPVTARDAQLMAPWAAAKRLGRTVQRPLPMPLFEAALEQELRTSDRVLTAVLTGSTANPLDGSGPPEVLLLAWHDADAHGPVSFVHVPPFVAEGILALTSPGRAAMACADETDQSVLDTAAVLWRESLAEASGFSLDDALAAARRL